MKEASDYMDETRDRAGGQGRYVLTSDEMEAMRTFLEDVQRRFEALGTAYLRSASRLQTLLQGDSLEQPDADVLNEGIQLISPLLDPLIGHRRQSKESHP